MKTLIQHNPALPDTKNNGQTLTINGLRKLINAEFMNKSLEETRDLWILSFILMGMDIREILTARMDETMPGIFLAHLNKDDTMPIPLYDIGNDIMDKYPGKLYALKFLEEGGTPGRIEGHRKATRIRFDLNRRMEVITKFLGFACLLPFENTRLTWMLLARENKVNDKVIGLMADFTINIQNRKLMNGNLERIAMANNQFMDFVYGISEKIEQSGVRYPVKRGDGSVLLYRD